MPDLADASWGVNLTAYLVALSTGSLQKAGGAFTLAGEVDFGGVFGLKALYFKTKTALPSITGVLRLAVTDTIGFRNNLNTADLPIGVNALDQLTYSGGVLNPATTKGDLIGFSTTSVRVPVGADAFGLIADSTQAAGVKWAALAAGLSPAAVSANVTTAVNNTMYLADSTSGAFQIIIPSGTTAFVMGVLDAGPKFSTNNVTVNPGGTNSIQNGAAAETLLLDVDGSTTLFYRAAGSSVIEIQTSSMTQYAPGFVPGYTGSAAISAGNVGEEIITTMGSSTPVTSNTPFNIGSVAVGTGTWEISGYVQFNTGTATSNTYAAWGISNNVTGNLGTVSTQAATSGGVAYGPTLPVRVIGPTTVYLAGAFNYAVLGTGAFSTTACKIRQVRIA